MTYADRWLLPDGIEEILPLEAKAIDSLRRQLMDLYSTWGYEMVIPPLLEYTDSLLVGSGRDVDLLTIKVTDQLSGRTLGLRADITPQTARIDAHSMARQGANRLCYTGHVIHARPKNPLATRIPIQAGVEFFGEESLAADIEVVSLLIESLKATGLQYLHLDLGHVGIYRALAEDARLTSAQEEEFFELLQRKATAEIHAWLSQNCAETTKAERLLALASLAGGREVLAKAKTLFGELDKVIDAITQLENLSDVIEARYPKAELYFDLGELRGYHYLTGIVFAAFAPGCGNPIASGGRYNHIGEVFGRARPATGFAVDVTALSKLGVLKESPTASIAVVEDQTQKQWEAISALRAQGERVVSLTQAGLLNELGCDRQLVLIDDQYQVVPL